MSNLPIFVGLDYHQDSIQVCVLNSQGEVLMNRSASNNCLELVERLGWNVSLGHPTYIARMKNSPDKSDFSDGRLIADLTRVGYLPRVWLAPGYIRELRQLVNHRQRLVSHATSLKLQVGAVLREQRVKIGSDRGGRWSRAWTASVKDNSALSEQGRWVVNDLLDQLAHGQGRIKSVEARLAEVRENDAVVKRLMNQPGIGQVTAWVLRACIGRFDRFKTGKQLARYCGMSPRNASSGERISDAGLIDACNPMLRATVVQAAHRWIRTIPRWAKLAGHLKRCGKPPCVAVAAVGNRWLRGLHHVMKGSVSDHN